MEIRLLTLGALRCFVGDIELTDLPAQRLRCAALLYLAVERETTREAAASLLWPERTSERARHAFSQKVYELRQVLGEEWLQTHGERMLVTPALRLDAREYEECAARGDAAAALALYNGDFLADFYLPESKEFESWVDRHRARLGRLHRKLRRDFIDQCVHAGDIHRAIAEARRWVELEPLEDEAQHRLIELLADTAQRAEAIRQYESYELSLKAQDLEPLDDTRTLMERVRQGNALPARSPAVRIPDVEPSQAGVQLPDISAVRAPASPTQGARVVWVALAALVLVGGGWWAARRYIPSYSTPARSIAVLPFLNLSAQPDASEHLSDGIAEELINALSQTDSLSVAARTSSFRFKNKDASIRTIGDSLRVALVVEGSVRQEGSRLRITAQLISVADGYHVWSNTFNGEVKDVLSVQEEIATAIVNALKIRLADPERVRLTIGGTSNAHAYEAFLRGRYLLQKGTRNSVTTSLQYLDSATTQDPRYANAYAELAQAYVLAAATRIVSRQDGLQTAKTAAERAIDLAPKLSEAHAALGRVELELWNWPAAERETRLAIALDRKNSLAHATYSRVLMVRGKIEDAVREAALAAQLEPLSAAAVDNHAEALRAARKYSDAVQIHRKALELEPNLGRQNLAKAYIELGMYDSALAQFDAAASSGAPRFPMIQLLWTAYTYARWGKREQAMILLRQFEGRQPQGPNAYLLASLYISVGNKERAFQLLEAGVDARATAWRQLPWDPVWDPVRHDARFRRILKQMNLEQ